MITIPTEKTPRINANKAFVATKNVQKLKNSSHGHSKKLITAISCEFKQLTHPTVFCHINPLVIISKSDISLIVRRLKYFLSLPHIQQEQLHGVCKDIPI